MGQQASRLADTDQADNPGKILLLSSGETSASGRRMYHRIFSSLGPSVRAAILETPAGFELNSAAVAQKVADFLTIHLSGFSPKVSVIPARRRDGLFSTNDPDLLAPMLEADYLYLGAGSPTYAAEHLKDSRALQYLLGRHQKGAALCLASAAAIAFGAKTLPVYEIFKAGQDLHWAEGVDFFGLFGLDLAIVTHWNNQEGGRALDTSRCFMGESRMEALREMLPLTTVLLGIDEHTGLLFDPQTEQCDVMGRGGVTLLRQDLVARYEAGATFAVQELGEYHPPAAIPGLGSPVGGGVEEPELQKEPPQEVMRLIERREAARQARDWPEADAIRQQISGLGFELQDTPEGPHWRYTG